MWWLSGSKNIFKDSRNIILINEFGSVAHNNDDPLPLGTNWTAYWELEKSYDYFRDIHGFWGTTQPPTVNRYQQQINTATLSSTGSLNDSRVGYQYVATAGDVYYFGNDDLSGTIPTSTAFLDIVGHEYTHAIIEHGPHLKFSAESQAIAEGFCDYFGTCLSTSFYLNHDWTNGFGWQTGQIARHWDNQNLDAPYPTAAFYNDTYPGAWNPSNAYSMSGVLRHFLYLNIFAGSYNGYTFYHSLPNPEIDAFVTMYWWMWDGTDFLGAAESFTAYYEYKYGKCSWQANAVINMWRAVGVSIAYPDCGQTHIIGPHVISTGDLGGAAQIKVSKIDTGSQNLILSYQWQIPDTWVVSYSADSSVITLLQVANNNSKILSCIVTLSDFTKDTLTTFLHIVGDVVTPKGVLAVTEISQGPANATDCEYAEILVANCGTDSSNYVDVRGWIIDDNSGNFDVAGCVTGKGITSGHYRLSNNEFWKFIPVGSKIVVYNGDANCYNLPDTFSIDNVNNIYWLPVPKQAQAGYLLQQYDGTENADICTYCSDTGKNVYKAARNWVATLDLDANHDGIQVRCPGCTVANPGNPDFYHGIAYANKAAVFAAIPPTNDDLGAALITNKTAGPYKYEFVGSSVADFGNASMWLVYKPDTAGARPYTIGRVKDNLAYNTQNHLLNLPCCAGNKGGRKAQPSTTTVANNPTITVYPNPAHTVINFALSQTGDAQIEIMNITGQLVQTLHISNNSIGTFNVTNLAKGLYIYKAVTNNKTQTGKIVIE